MSRRRQHGWIGNRRAAAISIALLLASGLAPGAASAASAPAGAFAEGAFDGGEPRVTATLLALPGSAGAAPRVGVLLAPAPGWHVYWRNPGGSGLATQVRFEIEGGTAGPLRWPAPTAFAGSDDVAASYGYSEAVLLASEVEGSQAPVRVRARVELLACENKCVPASFDLAREFPDALAASERALFADWEARIPVPAASRGLHLEALYSQDAIRPGDVFEGAVAVRCGAPGACASGLSAPRALGFFPDRLADVELTPRDARPHPSDPEVSLATFAGRAEASGGEVAARLRGVLALADGAGAATHVEVDLPLPRAAAGAAVAPRAPTWLAPQTSAPPASGLGRALGLAFLGGMLLNLMPCVLPVLVMKLVALAELARRHRREVLIHVAAYTAGISLTQLLLAGLVAGLRAAGVAVGWGFQFQEPLFLAGISTLLVVFALNLFGIFEIQLVPTRLAAVGAQATGARRSFFEGLLAVALATPCTAPFLGTAVGFAFASSGPVIAAIFLAIGLGLALPYAAVALAPGLARRMPRSGAWMGELRAVLGFALLGTVAWLLWVLGRNAGSDAVAILLCSLVALAFAARLFGRAQSGQHAGATLATGLAALALAVGGVNAVGVEVREEASPTAVALRAQPFDRARLFAVLAEGRPAFVYFTADWCLTCKLNERRVLADVRLQAALDALGYEVFRADWTRRDETIGEELARFGRAGVPLYVLYSGPGRATILPEILTLDGMIEALVTF